MLCDSLRSRLRSGTDQFEGGEAGEKKEGNFSEEVELGGLL